MKRVLLIMPSFQHGGTVRVAMSFIELYDKKKYSVDIFCLQKIGELEKYFKNCRILKSDIELATYISFSKIFKSLSFIDKFKAIYYYIKRKIFKKKSSEQIYKKSAIKITKKEKYDCIIAFQEGMATDFARFIPSEKRIAWVHCDYSRYYNMVKKDETNIYSMYNNIVCVSQYTAKIFSDYLPKVRDKVISIHNLMNYKNIIVDSNKSIDDQIFNNDNFTILSIGRMDPVKQFSKIPEIAEKLRRINLEFKWYIIGDGGLEKELVIQNINKYNINDNVILLGAKENPYPYLKMSDLLVCLSSSEACPNVINEARILHKPIVTTDFASVSEFIVDYQNGIITTIDDMADTLIEVINNQEILTNINENIKNYIYENDDILNDIDKVILEG